MILASFALALGVFALVGLASAARARGTTADYYLASRDIAAPLAGLSAVATNNSGYMFIGVIGYTYLNGLAALWLMVGWILGDWLGQRMVQAPLRQASQANGALTFAATLAHWQVGLPVPTRWLRLAALLTVLFLGSYAAAQIGAGSKALVALLGWRAADGALLTTALILAYCIAGGLRASIWTDVAQALVMLLAMGMLFAAAVSGRGGVAACWQALGEVPGYRDWFPADLWLPGTAGALLFVLGWLAAGLSVVGQPHVMVRFLALDDAGRAGVARAWYYGFFVLFYALATAVGLLSRLYLPDLAAFDPELALPLLARDLLHPALVGLMLAGIFAATLSTADSLVLACSATLTHDLPPRPAAGINAARLATFAVTLGALGIALAGPRSVFDLVVLSWSTLAVVFAPVLLLLVRGHSLSQRRLVAMLGVGLVVAWTWRAAGFAGQVYEGLPGMLAALAVGRAGQPRDLAGQREPRL